MLVSYDVVFVYLSPINKEINLCTTTERGNNITMFKKSYRSAVM